MIVTGAEAPADDAAERSVETPGSSPSVVCEHPARRSPITVTS
jgi:hypothetical protein